MISIVAASIWMACLATLCVPGFGVIELCEYCLLYILLCASACLCLVLSVCSFPFATLDNDEDEISSA